MHLPKRIGRKQFLTLTLTSTTAVAFGCSGDDGGEVPGASGAGGSGGASAGAAGSPGAGTFTVSGSSGSTSVSGSSGSATGGAGGGGAGGTAGGGGNGGSGGSAPLTPECSTKLKVHITADHGHVFQVTLADVMAGANKVYDTKGASDHPHWVQLTAADFSKLQAGGTVRKLSCNDGHEHEFIVNCLGVEKPTTSNAIRESCDAEYKCGEDTTTFCPALPEMP